MSYIVPMKKPICINCPFRNLDSCTLIYLMSDKDSEVTVHVNEMTVSPNCPLVEIPTPHGDLVDRQAAIDAVNSLTYPSSLKDVKRKLIELPPAEPKRGKWIYHIDDLFPAESTMECNQCHAEQPLICDDEFCPHCGAKMEVTE